METMEAIVTRRSIRKYLNQPVDEATIHELLRAGMYAPSARNTQAWHFVVIDDHTLLDDIPTFHPYSAMLPQAALAILVCGDLHQEKRVEYQAENCAAATQNVLLAAHALGLGAVWLGVYPNQDRAEGLTKLLGLPAHIVPISLIAVGHPDQQVSQPERFDDQKVHRNGW